MSTHTLSWLLGLCLLGGVTVSQADQSSDREAVGSLKAYAIYKSGDYDKARQAWLKLAEQGNTGAMVNLANLYEQGQGVEEDNATAAEWLRKAAERGDRNGQLNLGLAYEEGRGVEKDNRKAAHWFRKAAARGDKDAQFNLGVMLTTAYGAGPEAASSEQRREAVNWLSKAAEQGHTEASAFLRLVEQQ